MDTLLQAIWGRLRGIRPPAVQLAVLERPRSRRDALNRVLMIAAVVAAAVIPVFLGRGSGDLDEGAGEMFRGLQAELTDAEQELQELRDAGDEDSGAGREAAARVEQLRAATQLGYLQREGDETRVGGQAPDFRLLTLDGEPFRLSEVGRPMILNFWASWCAPCVEEMPDFQLVHEEFGDRLTMIGVNDGEDLETAVEFQGRTGVKYVVLLDPTTQLTNGPYVLIGRPTTFYIDAEGVIRDVRVGIHTLEDMRGLAAGLLGEGVADRSEAPASPEYAAQAQNLIDSGRANFGVGSGLLDDWAENPSLFEDPGWQRNIVAQTRVWDSLAAQSEELEAPSSVASLHAEVSAWLRSITDAGAMVREAVEGADPGELAAARQLLDAAAAAFGLAADDLESALRSS